MFVISFEMMMIDCSYHHLFNKQANFAKLRGGLWLSFEIFSCSNKF